MVTVRSSPEAVAEYQALLTAEWGKSLAQDVLELLWTMTTAQTESEKNDALIQILDPAGANSFQSKCFQAIVARIADGTSFVRLAKFPKLSTGYTPAKNLPRAAAQANRLATYLTLPAHTPVSGNREFLVDVQALGFQAAIHFVLPDLRKKYPAEHALLLHAAILFAVGYSAYEPAHYAYMMSMVHGYLGDENQRLRSLFAAFRFTPPQDHSYLTKAQEFWSELIDQDKPEEAERFLLSLHWWSLPAQQDEVREMVVDAFKHILSTNRPRARTGGAKR